MQPQNTFDPNSFKNQQIQEKLARKCGLQLAQRETDQAIKELNSYMKQQSPTFPKYEEVSIDHEQQMYTPSQVEILSESKGMGELQEEDLLKSEKRFQVLLETEVKGDLIEQIKEENQSDIRKIQKDYETTIHELQSENNHLKDQLKRQKNDYQSQLIKLKIKQTQSPRVKQKPQSEVEEILENNRAFYQEQISDLEKVISQQNLELVHRNKSLAFTKQDLQSVKNQLEIFTEEQGYSKRKLQDEVEQLRQFKDECVGGNQNKEANYIMQLETNMKIQRDQIDQLTRTKTALQIKLESEEMKVGFSRKNILDELELKFKAEQRELTFLVNSLSKDILKKKTKKSVTKGKLKLQIQEMAQDINALRDTEFELQQKCQWLEFQVKNSQKNEPVEESDVEQLDIIYLYERRCKTLSEGLLLWKQKAEILDDEYQDLLQQYRYELDSLKKQVIKDQKSIAIQLKKGVKQIQAVYRHQKTSLREEIADIQENHMQDKAKLAQMRSKIQQISLKKEFTKKHKSKRKRVS